MSTSHLQSPVTAQRLFQLIVQCEVYLEGAGSGPGWMLALFLRCQLQSLLFSPPPHQPTKKVSDFFSSFWLTSVGAFCMLTFSCEHNAGRGPGPFVFRHESQFVVSFGFAVEILKRV